MAVLTGSRAHEAGLAAFTRAGGVVMRLVGDDPQGRAESTGGTEAADPLRVTEAAALLHSVDLVLDAVLGTGASGGLRGPVADLVRAFEEQRDADARGERSGPRVAVSYTHLTLPTICSV